MMMGSINFSPFYFETCNPQRDACFSSRYGFEGNSLLSAAGAGNAARERLLDLLGIAVRPDWAAGGYPV